MGDFVHVYDEGGGIRDVSLPNTISAFDREALSLLFGLSKDVYPPVPSSSTCWLFAHPTTMAAQYLTGQREIYVPVDSNGNYFGVHFGSKAKAHTQASITDMGVFKPGLFTWHGSLTKVGSFNTSPANPAAGTFNSTGASYSLTAGDTISGTVTGTVAAIRTYSTTNGGNAIVAIDGDYTRANKLPEFTAADYAASRCRDTDVGKRYISCYSVAGFNDCITLATDLTAGSHTITVEVTGCKPAYASAARVYIEGFGACNGNTFGTANVYPIPIQWIYHDVANWSAFCYVPQWAPTGSVDYQFMGEIHGDNVQSKEVQTSLTVTVNVTDQTALAAGTFTSGQNIILEQVSTLAHKVNTATVVATKTRKLHFSASRKFPLLVDQKIAWSAAGVINTEYAVMLPLGEYVNSILGNKQDTFDTLYIGQNKLPVSTLNADAVTNVNTETRRLVATGAKITAYAEVLATDMDGSSLYANRDGLYQDRSDKLDKLYVITAGGIGPQTLPIITRRFLVGFGAFPS